MTGRQPAGPSVGLGLMAAAAVAAGVSLLIIRRKGADNERVGFATGMTSLSLDDMTLVQHERPSDGSRWCPYAAHDCQFNDSWWDRRFPTESKYSLWSAYLGDTEVVRIQLNRWFDYSDYLEVPHLGHATIGIEYVETANDFKGRHGCGGRAIELLTEVYPDHRFLAETHDAPTYWGRKLGWVPYRSQHGYHAGWTLFVAPAGWPHPSSRA